MVARSCCFGAARSQDPADPQSDQSYELFHLISKQRSSKLASCSIRGWHAGRVAAERAPENEANNKRTAAPLEAILSGVRGIGLWPQMIFDCRLVEHRPDLCDFSCAELV